MPGPIPEPEAREGPASRSPSAAGEGAAASSAEELRAARKERDLAATELALIRSFLNRIPDTLYLKDEKSRFTWVNAAQARVLGLLDAEKAVGKTDFDFFSAQHAEEAFRDEARILETGEPLLDKVEEDNLPDGTARWVSTTKVPLRDEDGRVVGTCGLSRDVTLRVRAERALERESSLLKALLDHIPDAIYFKDTESRFVRVSRFVHLLGLSRPEEAIGKTDFDFFPEEHARQAFEDEQRIVRTGEPLLDKVEKETSGEAGSTYVSTTKVPILDGNGKVTGIVGISRDITARVRAEETLRRAKEDLEVRVAERTGALVQEIRQHLKVQKALKESEKKLQEANLRLRTRVNQLNYLNATAQKLARSTSRRELLPALLAAFTDCLPGIEAALLEAGAAAEGEAKPGRSRPAPGGAKGGRAEGAGAAAPGKHPGYRITAATPAVSAAQEDDAGLHASLLALPSLFGAEDPKGPLLVADRSADARFASLPFPGLEELPVLLLLPLRSENRPPALLALFGAADLLDIFLQESALIQTLLSQSATGLSNANNFAELERKARIEGELEVAQRIQRRFTPQGNPQIPHLRLHGVYQPAYEVGGDYLDYFQSRNGSWVLVVADVSGKGIPAALVMTMLRSTFRAEARTETSAKKLLCAVNESMVGDLDDKSFVTALCLIVSPDGRRLSYARAGHIPLILKPGRRAAPPVPLSPRGIALGMVGGEQFERIMQEVELTPSPGDQFLVCTDGLVEAMDPDQEIYGMPRLLTLLGRAEREAGPAEIIGLLLDDVKAFMGGAAVHDDLTILALEALE